MLSTLGVIVRDLLIVIGALTVLLFVVAIIAIKLPPQNPVKRLLTALSFRLGATVFAAIFAIPIEAVPALDVVYEVGAPILLLLYWISFFRKAVRMRSAGPKSLPERVPHRPRS